MPEQILHNEQIESGRDGMKAQHQPNRAEAE